MVRPLLWPNTWLIILLVSPIIPANLKVLWESQSSTFLEFLALQSTGHERADQLQYSESCSLMPSGKKSRSLACSKGPFLLPGQRFSFISHHYQYLPHQYHVPRTLNFLQGLNVSYILSLSLGLCYFLLQLNFSLSPHHLEYTTIDLT